jgi:hypothetical protein
MKTYTVENDEGRQVTFEWDDDNNPPTDSDMEEIFAASKTQESEPPLPEEKELPTREEQLAYLASRKPSEVFGDVAKGLTKNVTQALPDIPYIAKKGVEAVKGLWGAGGQLFTPKNYANVIDHPIQAGKGAVKGLGSTALGMGASIAQDSPALRQINYDLTGKDDLQYNPPQRLQPKTEAEQSGANLAGSALAIGGTLLSAKPIARAGFKAVSSPSAAKMLKDLGNRGQNITTKILTKEADSGAKIENIGKHGLFGSEDVALKKGKTIVDDTYAQLKSVLEEENVPENYKSISSALEDAQNLALSTAKKDRGAIISAFKKIKEDYLGSEDVPGYFKTDKIDLAEAQMLKQDAASNADWHHLSFHPNADNAKGVAYKAISNVLRKHLEDAGGPKVRELNKKMSEVIPINTANAKRFLVNSRKNPIPLDDFVGYLTSASSLSHGNPLPAMITVGNKIIKSPAFAEKVYKLGDKMEKGLPKIEPKELSYPIYTEEFGGKVALPRRTITPTFYRKGVPVIERDGRLVSKGEDYTRRDWDTPTPTKRDRLDIWETKGKPMEGVKRELPLDITPTTRSRIDPFEARGRNIEGVNRGEPIPLTPVDMAKIAEELAKMKKQGMLGITR